MSLEPAQADFVRNDRILQGADWSRTVPMPQDMTAYDPAVTPGAVLRGSVKSADGLVTYASTEAGTMVLSFDDAFTLRVEVTNASSNVAAFTGGRWEVEGVNGFTSKVDRIAEGSCDMAREYTTAAT